MLSSPAEMYPFSHTLLLDPVIRIRPRRGSSSTANCSAVIFSSSILSALQPFQPSVDNTNAVAGPSSPLRKKFHTASAKVPGSKGMRKSVDEDGTVEQHVVWIWLRCATNFSHNSLFLSDVFPLASCETPKFGQKRAMHGEGLYTPDAKDGIDVLARQEVWHEFDEIGTVIPFRSHVPVLFYFSSHSTTAFLCGRCKPLQTH